MTISIILTILAVLISVFGYLFIAWTDIQEGTTVYRCDSNMENRRSYHVIMLSGHKYLASNSLHEPYTRYDFWDYFKDIQTHRVFTEEQMDNFD